MPVTPLPGRRVCGVVVAFFPDMEFRSRIEQVMQQVDALLVVDNTPSGGCRDLLASLTSRHEKLVVVESHRNVGVAAALNQGLAHAAKIGCDWLLTLDQDTQVYPIMVETLLRTYADCRASPAIVGSNYLDPRRGRPAFPSTGVGRCVEAKTVITSGSLILVTAAQAIGGFREDYFIDQVDHEFCLRIRAHGYRVAISQTPVMTHSVGEAGGVNVPFFGSLPNHSPTRKYYIARNSIVTIADYWSREPMWCLRRLIKLSLGFLLIIIAEKKQRRDKARAFVAGIQDGINRRLGPLHDHLSRQ